MDFKRFDHQNLFEEMVCNKMSLFCGAGFSILAKDKDGKELPLGESLLKELQDFFPRCKKQNDLSKAAQVINASPDKEDFMSFLTQRFTVYDYDSRYNNLTSLGFHRVFTTNIDDLLYKVFSTENACNTESKYINTTNNRGQTYKEGAINYYALHGCVRHQSPKYIFSKRDIASAYTSVIRTERWDTFKTAIQNDAILFWGWNFDDSDVLGAIPDDISHHIWAILYDPADGVVEYVQSMGFHIIISETSDMLDYLMKFISSHKNNSQNTKAIIQKSMIRYCIPQKGDVPSTPFEKFFSEYSPEWSFIYSGEVPKTHWLSEVENYIASGKNVLVYSMRGCGKTTLMMQLLHFYSTEKPKHFLDEPTIEEASIYLKELGQTKALLFVDNCFRDTDALILLMNSLNVQVIGFDRDYSFERQNYKLNPDKYISCDITFVNDTDVAGIIEKIPEHYKEHLRKKRIRMPDFGIPIVVLLSDILQSHCFGFARKLADEDDVVAEVLTLVCYVNSCGVPASYDMIYSYLNDGNRNWQDVYAIIEGLGGLIHDATHDARFESKIDLLQDYYGGYSHSFSESIIKSASWKWDLFAIVLLNFVERVPIYKICMFDKFRKYGYDAEYAYKAFWNKDDNNDNGYGECFYSTCLKNDDSEYIYQQAAMYFAKIKDFKKAFDWIDKAYNLLRYDRYSIRFTHALIRFDANLNSNNSLIELQQSLDMMEETCKMDMRSHIRIEPFARYVITFSKKHPKEAKTYLINALAYIEKLLGDEDTKNKISKSTIRKLENHHNNITVQLSYNSSTQTAPLKPP